jgi:hypothetical protein
MCVIPITINMQYRSVVKNGREDWQTGFQTKVVDLNKIYLVVTPDILNEKPVS